MNLRLFFISTVLFFIVIISEYIAYTAFNNSGIIKSGRVDAILMILGVVFPLLFLISMMYSYRHYTLFNSWVNSVSSVWLAGVSYIFLVALFVFILILTNNQLVLNLPIRLISNILVAGVLVLVVYGVWHSSNPQIIRYEIISNELSKDWSGKKIVLISDTHLGDIRRERFMRRVVDLIKSENPDITFNVGDFIDGPSIPYKKWLAPWTTLNPELGNHYVEGNHEQYSKEYEFFKTQLPESINNLTNKKVIVNNTQIIGLSYVEKETGDRIKSRLKLLEHDPNLPSIILVHDPKNVRALSLSGVSLILSGHTHGGQFFPLTIVVNKLYKEYSHGVAYTNNTPSITSYGVGTSIIPNRIGTHPEIVVITIK
jgi:hypothetical protein